MIQKTFAIILLLICTACSLKRQKQTAALATLPTMTATPTVSLTPVVSNTPPCQLHTDWQVYTVVTGDTLSLIAHRTNSSVDELMVANCLSDADRLLLGTQLYVPKALLVALTPLPIPAGCFEIPFLPDSGIEVGGVLQIVTTTTLMSSPAPRGIPLLTLLEGIGVTVMGNPSCFPYGSDFHQREWWVRTEDGTEGYVKEYVAQKGTVTVYAVPRR